MGININSGLAATPNSSQVQGDGSSVSIVDMGDSIFYKRFEDEGRTEVYKDSNGNGILELEELTNTFKWNFKEYQENSQGKTPEEIREEAKKLGEGKDPTEAMNEIYKKYGMTPPHAPESVNINENNGGFKHRTYSFGDDPNNAIGYSPTEQAEQEARESGIPVIRSQGEIKQETLSDYKVLEQIPMTASEREIIEQKLSGFVSKYEQENPNYTVIGGNCIDFTNDVESYVKQELAKIRSGGNLDISG